MSKSEMVVLREELVKAVSSLRNLEKDFVLCQKNAEQRELEAALKADKQARLIDEQARLIDEQARTIRQLRDELEKTDKHIKAKDARLGYYESPNQPTSAKSLFNNERRAFRRKEMGNEQADSKAGAKPGHAGTSHHDSPVRKVRYNVDRCEKCSSANLRKIRPINKSMREFDGDYMHIICIGLIIERAVCKCGHTSVAKNPSTVGTCFGPKALGVILLYHAKRCTDQTIANFMEELYDLKIGRSSLWNARIAIKNELEGQYRQILDHIRDSDYLNIDESVIKINSKNGRIWLATARDATYIVASPHRTKAAADEYFSALYDVPAVHDSYKVYNSSFTTNQECWVHILRFSEGFAIKQGGHYKIQHRRLNAFYSDIKKMDTADEPTILDLDKRLREIISSYPEKDPVRTRLENALPNLFTYLRVPGMPPHNNRAELELRDTAVLQANTRHKLVTPEGMHVFSVMLSFSRTCQNLKLNIWKSFVVSRFVSDWNMFESGLPPTMPYAP